MRGVEIVRSLHARLVECQLACGGWSFGKSPQAILEPTCLALLALHAKSAEATGGGLQFLLRCQNTDGSWPAFAGDDAVGSWATALAVITLKRYATAPEPTRRALKWILAARGREVHWLWRWKFLLVDRKVRFDPDKFGWPWTSDTVSWVIPTAFCLVAIRQCAGLVDSDSANFRINRGTAMLIDRACPGGGWNAGNPVAFDTALAPMLDPTAAALLALSGKRHSVIDASLDWLARTAPDSPSVFSLAWSVLALAVHGRTSDLCLDRLTALCSMPVEYRDSATLAVASLALQAGAGTNPLEAP